MDYLIVSGILAQALTTLPKITGAELFEKCAGQIGNTNLVNFRIQLTKWLNDGTIPGYEARLGRNGGIYKKGAPKLSLTDDSVKENKVELSVIREALNQALVIEAKVKITAGELFLVINPDVSEAQFKTQLSHHFSDGDLNEYESRRAGKAGGIYLRGAESEKWTAPISEDSEEEVENFSVQISPTMKIVQSDDRNWTIQKLSGETWQNKAYHSDIGSCIRSVVKHTINGEFKLSGSLVQLKELYSVFKEMENRITAQLEKSIVIQA